MLFDILNTNKDGFITKEEFNARIEKDGGRGISDIALTEMFAKVDLNKDRKISF
jgi:Ca2+-binding EF-hand superfamily protein